MTQMSFLWFTAFVGVNLFQSGFTTFCPLDTILARLGVPVNAPEGCSTGRCG
jgi:hypothetical protein